MAREKTISCLIKKLIIPKMSISMRLTTTILSIYILIGLTSCDNDEQPTISITGSVKYASDNSSAKSIPLRLEIIDNETGNTVLLMFNKSDKEGRYKFVVSSKKLQHSYPYSYNLSTAIDTLIIIDHWNPCLSSNSNRITLTPFDPLQNYQLDIDVDQIAYLEIIFNKVNPSSTDEILYNYCGLVIEAIENRILQVLPYSYYNSINITYYVLKDTGETIESRIYDIKLKKNDITKVVVDF